MKDSFGVDVAPGDYILSAPSNKWGRPKIGIVYAAPSGRLMVDVEHGPASERSKVEIGLGCAVLRKANGDVPAHIGTAAPVNRDGIDAALRHFLAHEDYDLHKAMECGEEDGEDHYPEAVDEFIQVYEGAL